MAAQSEGLQRLSPSRRPAWPATRERAKRRFAAGLREEFLLRLHIALILAGTVLAGAFASKLAFDLGWQSMPWRHLLGLGVAYLTFLALVRLWIAYVEGWRPEPNGQDLIDGCDAAFRPSDGFEAGGGRFGGGGASSGWGQSQSVSSAGDSGLSFDVDLGEVLLILVVAALVFTMLGGLVYVFAIGPELLTEAAFEVVLAGSLARRTHSSLRGRWLLQVIRTTALPFVIVTTLTMGLGFIVQDLCPEALRLRDVVTCVQDR